MGYVGHVTGMGMVDILDIKFDIERTIGRQIELGFVPDIPKDERKYTLKNAMLGIDVKGAYIHFYLEDNGVEKEFIITGIKNFEYEVYETYTKYWVCTSNDLLFIPEKDATSIPVQNGDVTYRFFLYIDDIK